MSTGNSEYKEAKEPKLFPENVKICDAKALYTPEELDRFTKRLNEARPYHQKLFNTYYNDVLQDHVMFEVLKYPESNFKKQMTTLFRKLRWNEKQDPFKWPALITSGEESLDMFDDPTTTELLHDIEISDLSEEDFAIWKDLLAIKEDNPEPVLKKAKLM